MPPAMAGDDDEDPLKNYFAVQAKAKAKAKAFVRQQSSEVKPKPKWSFQIASKFIQQWREAARR